jgi:ElaB/YqjD/DUF883 family membrane-anchored ribosome-binding protein
MSEKVEAPSDELREAYAKRVAQIREDLDGLIGDLGDRVGDADRAVREGFARAEHAVREGVDETEARIRERPFLALGVATALGFVLGLAAGLGSRER